MDPKFVDDVCSTLETAVDIVRSANADLSAPTPSRDRVAAVAEGLKSETAKVGYMFSQKDIPGKVAGESLLAGVRDTATTLCMLFAAAAAGGGPTLCKSLQATASAVIEPVLALIKCAASATSASAEQLHQLAGLCMERCDAAMKAPLDDRTAIGRALASVARQMADAASEIKEEEENLEKSENGEGSDELEELEEREEETVELDVQVLKAARAVVEAAVQVMRDAMRALLTADASPTCGGDTWESVLFHSRQLAATVDDLAIGAYTNDTKEMTGALEALVNGCELMQEEVPGEAVAGAVEEVAKAAKELMGRIDGE